jgi:hypothetical protein
VQLSVCGIRPGPNTMSLAFSSCSCNPGHGLAVNDCMYCWKMHVRWRSVTDDDQGQPWGEASWAAILGALNLSLCLSMDSKKIGPKNKVIDAVFSVQAYARGTIWGTAIVGIQFTQDNETGGGRRWRSGKLWRLCTTVSYELPVSSASTTKEMYCMVNIHIYNGVYY